MINDVSFLPQIFKDILKKIWILPPSRVGVAVSGGSDSLALLTLVHLWAQEMHIEVIPLIVDHGIAQCAGEAEKTVQWVDKWGLSGEILSWNEKLSLKNLMLRARQKRYEALALACYRRNIQHLFLGHQEDELLETVLMRQLRHSGWRGQAGISQRTHLYGIELIRPFLGLPRFLLQKWLSFLGQPWISDPTNDDPQFLRTQMRAQVMGLSYQERTALLKQIYSYGKQRQEEAEALGQLYHLTSQEGILKIEGEYLWDLSPSQGAVVLRSWMDAFSPIPRNFSALMQLWDHLKNAFYKKSTSTLLPLLTGGGCLFLRQGETLYMVREGARRDDVRKIPQGAQEESFIWDHRFFCFQTGALVLGKTQGNSFWDQLKTQGFPHLWPHPKIVHQFSNTGYPTFSPALSLTSF